MRSVTIRTRSALAVAAVVMPALAVAGCGGGFGSSNVSKPALVAKLAKEKDLQGVPKKGVECVAQIMLKHAKNSDLHEYMDGKRSVQDVHGTGSDSQLQNEVVSCLKQ